MTSRFQIARRGGWAEEVRRQSKGEHVVCIVSFAAMVWHANQRVSTIFALLGKVLYFSVGLAGTWSYGRRALRATRRTGKEPRKILFASVTRPRTAQTRSKKDAHLR
eukprot:843176-Rhodomonas_salina.2